MKILVADDDAVSRLLMQRTLRQKGFEVITATNGSEALSLLLREDGPRLVLLARTSAKPSVPARALPTFTSRCSHRAIPRRISSPAWKQELTITSPSRATRRSLGLDSAPGSAFSSLRTFLSVLAMICSSMLPTTPSPSF